MRRLLGVALALFCLSGQALATIADKKVQNALRDIYLQFNGDEWPTSEQTGWPKPVDLLAERRLPFLIDCYAANITCDQHQNITGLNLSGLLKQKTGKLSPEIAQLSHLKYLDLSRNHLTALPEAISFLPQLESLDLTSTPYLHDLPNSLNQLTNLKQLTLRASGIRKLPTTIAELRSLESLDISQTQIDHLPGNFAELRQLKKLNLAKSANSTA